MLSTRVCSLLCLVFSLFGLSRAGPLNINTPSLIQCKSAYLSWDGDYPPFAVSIVSQKNGSIIENFFQKSSQNLTWIVNIPSGTSVALKVIDSKKNVNWSNGVTIQPSSNSSCLSAPAAVMEPSASSRMVVGANATIENGATAGPHAPLNGSMPTGTTSGIGANAAATTTSRESSATRASAGLGLLLACLALALVA